MFCEALQAKRMTAAAAAGAMAVVCPHEHDLQWRIPQCVQVRVFSVELFPKHDDMNHRHPPVLPSE